jgi:acyl carrier protein
MKEELASLAADVLGIERSSVVPELSREHEDQWDSLGHLRLVTAIEERFGIRLSMEEIESSMTIADLEHVIEQHSNTQ